jgi:aspartate/methionine/tyrosine aminotransferase
MQHAAAAALELAEANGYYATLKSEYTARRDQLAAILTECGLSPLPVQGSFFINADVSGLGFATDVEFCRWLTSEIGVAAVPPSAFYLDTERAPLLARFCFAKKPETLAAAAERLGLVQSRLARV